MNIGLLWFDNESERSLKEKIGNAVSHYSQRFGDKPTVCYMHPETLDDDFNSLRGVRLKTHWLAISLIMALSSVLVI